MRPRKTPPQKKRGSVLFPKKSGAGTGGGGEGASEAPVLVVPPPKELRDQLEIAAVRDLLGPAGGPEEEIDDPRVGPRDRYVVGMLGPAYGQQPLLEGLDTLSVEDVSSSDDDNETDVSLPPAQSLVPSSYGLSFCVGLDTEAIVVKARWGRYRRVPSETQTTETGAAKTVWKRTPVEVTSPPLSLGSGSIGPWVVDGEHQPEVRVQGIARPHAEAGVYIVSLFLVNGQSERATNRDEAWLFQAGLAVRAPDGSAIFQHRPALMGAQHDAPEAEQAALAMLYRNRVELAVGHGVGVRAEVDKSDPRRAVEVSTQVVPSYDVCQQRPLAPGDPPTCPGDEEVLGHLGDLVLDMKALAEAEDDALPARLEPLPEAYAAWIRARRAELEAPGSDLSEHSSTAKRALARCEEALARIREGIELLRTDAMARDAFRFANRAMWHQRIHTMLGEKRRREPKATPAGLDVPKNRTWRTFQLAFLLLNLPSATDPLHPERSHETGAVADLLWYPTGGGKTEAYLGLAAYVMGLRRLQGELGGRAGGAGIAVLMRYTLRLLTLQQFQRAATLICACEVIRRETRREGKLLFGDEPFRIGLWVGSKTTPNKTKHADEWLKQVKKTRAWGGLGRGSPSQLTSCPWCGTAIDKGQHVKVDRYGSGSGRTLTYCGDHTGRCPFTKKNAKAEGIPIIVVDEEIYRRLPTLLIATVDKFAQMPWNGAVQTLFGQVEGRCPRHGFRSPEIEDADRHPKRKELPAVRTEPLSPLRPPDLIIQDELHLISGPLGTLTGLYETAVEALCTWELGGETVRPKVIASTATVRRAPEQVHALFQRDVRVFPPHGLFIEDSFFARERPLGEYPGRRYVGICAPGVRVKKTLIRVYLALMSAAQQLYDRYGKAADPWMTLVGYFSSIRELAGMRRLVDDDVKSRLRDMHQRGLARRLVRIVEELTSRKASTDIPYLLGHLEVGFDPVADQVRREARKQRKKTSAGPIDVLLATSMLSVGVDVKRLGLMVCAGQPKQTAEYIQATSRVGRTHPGLVVTAFNWARPRDLSHYEGFEHYHATFYQNVEALSLTPFAPRALDRGLSALLVSLVRLAAFSHNRNADAERVEDADALLDEAVRTIVRRAELVGGEASVATRVEADLRARIKQWKAEAQRSVGSTLGYKQTRDGKTRGLLKQPGVGAWETFTCPNSLRNVEPAVKLVLQDGNLDQDWGSGGGA